MKVHGLEIIATDLPGLEHLDISNTRVTDISSVRKCRDRMKSLSIYNIRPLNEDEVIPIL
jgi:Zyg-11 family protein